MLCAFLGRELSSICTIRLYINILWIGHHKRLSVGSHGWNVLDEHTAWCTLLSVIPDRHGRVGPIAVHVTATTS